MHDETSATGESVHLNGSLGSSHPEAALRLTDRQSVNLSGGSNIEINTFKNYSGTIKKGGVLTDWNVCDCLTCVWRRAPRGMFRKVISLTLILE